mgnify:CR=1 FL=1
MTISKERLEELRDKLLLRLQADLEEEIHTTIEEAGKDALAFLFNYISCLKRDIRAAKGNSSSDSYVYIPFPLNKKEFTEEELEYLGFYKDNVFYDKR